MHHATTSSHLLDGPIHSASPTETIPARLDERTTSDSTPDSSSIGSSIATMDYPYPSIPGTSAFTPRPLPRDGSLPEELVNPPMPTRGGKNMFAYWHTGIQSLKPYLMRNVLAWYQRYSSLGWNIYVLDRQDGSPLNVSRFIDLSDPEVVPDVMRDGGSVTGQYSAQHSSDLVRWPLLLKYGGAYLDVGVIMFGDMDRLWEEHIANPDSPFDYAGFTMGDAPDAISIVNFWMMSTPDNPLMQRAHRIFLKLWEGKTDTTGAHANPLVSHVPLLRVPDNLTQSDDGKDAMTIDDAAMTDYAVQIQAMGSAQRWFDEEGKWDGPSYVQHKCYLLSMIQHAYVNEQLSGWDSAKQHQIFLTPLPPTVNSEETETQRLGRQIVEESVAGSWVLKLAHGFSARLFGKPTLGMLWRDDEGSDCKEGTYGGWLRWATVNSRPERTPEALGIMRYEPTMRGSLEAMLKC
ncbi:hypothetical protein NLU13_5315 [Sarocladium strictum]|uniref:Capsule polysaccharide biosynthesis protein n=1 Tax=Sarocladium strictum TaxID=5046 RepID=A0AA39L737_SARSR|nr:hypothetical protein NLU13_5315 [Sarocladium strictum]